ncbi:hypothetical protein [Streptomyces sp. NPDC002690]
MAAKKKILTIKLEIEVNEKVTRYNRLRDTYSEVVRAAIEAARAHLPTDSIEQVTTQARWEYRHWDPESVVHPRGEIDVDEEFSDDDFLFEDEA